MIGVDSDSGPQPYSRVLLESALSDLWLAKRLTAA
jgi:hypothetical protein